MKIKLRIRKHGATLFVGSYEVSDPDSFGNPCADAWCRLRASQHDRAANVGELMDMQASNILDELEGAEISISKA